MNDESTALEETPRIAIYGVGNYGSIVARLASRKGWRVVAAYNRAGDKVGQDLGQLTGMEKDLGVIVQDCDKADYSKLDADVAIVTTTDVLEENWPAYERLLGAGANVICHGGQASYPNKCNPEVAERIEKVALSNGVSFMGSSVWDYSRIWSGILAMGPCLSASKVTHTTLTNVNYPREEIAEKMGIGLTPAEFDQKLGSFNGALAPIYITVMQQVVEKCGLSVMGSSSKIVPALLDIPVFSAAYERNIEAGSVVGYSISVDIDTAEGVAVSGDFQLRILCDGETENFRWDIEGTPSSSIVVERKDSELASAACMLNRVPDIINAEPGIRLVSHLGPLTARLS